jgi:hypothetical protein
MTRSIASLQRYVQEQLGSNEGSLILDVQVSFNLQYCFIL